MYFNNWNLISCMCTCTFIVYVYRVQVYVYVYRVRVLCMCKCMCMCITYVYVYRVRVSCMCMCTVGIIRCCSSAPASKLTTTGLLVPVCVYVCSDNGRIKYFYHTIGTGTRPVAARPSLPPTWLPLVPTQ